MGSEMCIRDSSTEVASAVVVMSENGRMLGLGLPDAERGIRPKVVFEAKG